jgi:hypothetical protein
MDEVNKRMLIVLITLIITTVLLFLVFGTIDDFGRGGLLMKSDL